MLIARAHNYCVNFFGSSVFEKNLVFRKMGDQRDFFHSLRPVKTDWIAAIAQRNGTCTMLIALNSDILRRIAASDQQQVLIFKLIGSSEVVSVDNMSYKIIDSFKIGHIRSREMTGSHNEVVKFF